MNKIKISNKGEAIIVNFEFESIEVAQQYFQDEEYLADLREELGVVEEKKEAQLNDNDMLRASIQTQIAETSTRTLEGMVAFIQDELKKRK